MGKLQSDKGGNKAEAGRCLKQATLQGAAVEGKGTGRLRQVSIACTELVTVAV